MRAFVAIRANSAGVAVSGEGSDRVPVDVELWVSVGHPKTPKTSIK